MFIENKTIEPVLGAVVKAAHMALHREDTKLYNTDKEKTLYAPQDTYYKTQAINCVDSGICIDLFLFPNTYIDVATIGKLYKYVF
ncbi:9784_t:CDS:2 [Entrophospora sp. SA101]|nr:9784_t:CDS:2 [Entrophospora sp. SA101]